MATYSELSNIHEDPGYGSLVNKIRVAVVDKAVSLLGGATPTASEVVWALSALENPATVANGLTHFVVVANKSATVAQILAATDVAVQTNVDSAVDKIVSV